MFQSFPASFLSLACLLHVVDIPRLIGLRTMCDVVESIAPRTKHTITINIGPPILRVDPKNVVDQSEVCAYGPVKIVCASESSLGDVVSKIERMFGGTRRHVDMYGGR